MIVILKKSAERQQVELFNTWLHNMGLETHMSVGENHTIVGLVGDTSRVDMESILALDIVETVKRIQEPYKNANRKFHEEGIRLLLEAKAATGLPIVTEIMDAKHLPLFEDIDVIQVGARNMQNFELLKELGRLRKPVLIKRGMANTLQELLMSAEYVMAGGNDQVILCERGIRTFETATRNTMDLSVIPILHQLTHLPVVVDPSHATGRWELVAPMALGATACGADGLIIEVHNDPEHALCDGPQSLRPEKFAGMMEKIRAIRPYADRSFTTGVSLS